MNAVEKKPKKSGQKRGHSTQATVLSAAIEVLSEHGYVNFGAATVAARAGVSRGALERYFPTKSALLIAALQHAADSAIQYANEIVAQGGVQSANHFLLSVERFFFSPFYRAIIELGIAAEHIPTLKQTYNPFMVRTRDALTSLCVEELVRAGYALHNVKRFVLLTHHLMRGIFIAETWLPENMPDRRTVLDTWSQVAESILGPRQQLRSDRSGSIKMRNGSGHSIAATSQRKI